MTRALAVSLSRRTIVRTSAKLAYAAPVVAASMRLTGGITLAAVSGGVICPAGCGAVANLAGGVTICTSRITPLDSEVVCCDTDADCTGDNDHDCVLSYTDLETGTVTLKVCPSTVTPGLCQTVVPCT